MGKAQGLGPGGFCGLAGGLGRGCDPAVCGADPPPPPPKGPPMHRCPFVAMRGRCVCTTGAVRHDTVQSKSQGESLCSGVS